MKARCEIHFGMSQRFIRFCHHANESVCKPISRAVSSKESNFHKTKETLIKNPTKRTKKTKPF